MYNKMTQTRNRYGNRWTINECLQLQREFELLNLPIDEIAKRHKRTPKAIMFKLDKEEFADINLLWSSYYSNSSIPTKNDLNPEFDQEEEFVDDDSDYEEEEEQEEGDDLDDIKKQIMNLGKQVLELTKMFMNKDKN
jgi:hypothetical protein